MEHCIRSWGEYWVLEAASNHKVRRILVNTKGCLSYKYQDYRDIWIMILAGVGHIASDGIVNDYKEGDFIIIPKGIKHSIENSSEEPLVFIEIQHGTYFGKEDFVLIEENNQST